MVSGPWADMLQRPSARCIVREPAQPCPPQIFAEDGALPARRRPLPVRPRHVHLRVRLDPTGPARVEGSVTHTVEAIGADVRTLPLDAADLEITGAWQGERALEWVQHAGGVRVDLGEPLAARERVSVRLDFVAEPSVGLYFVTGEEADASRPQVWTQGAMEDHHHWFPCFDAPEHLVTTEVEATVPEPFSAIANGVPVGPEAGTPAESGWRRFHWRHAQPHALYLLTLVVDTVERVVVPGGPVPMIHYAPPGRAADTAAHFARMGEMIEWFGQATGCPYPYPRYGHAFLQRFMWGGMENTTLTSLTDEVLVPAEHLAEQDVERLYAHELAHQWFGDLIAPRGWTEIWLNESFATYFEVLCMAALEGPDDFALRMLAKRDAYLAEARGRYARAVVTRRFTHPYLLFDRHAYEKGSLVLHTLRDQLGDAAFFRGVRRYVSEQRGQAAETAQLRRAFEVESGADLSDFFEDMVYGAAHPRVQVSWSYLEGEGLSVRLRRLDETPQRLSVRLGIRAGARRHDLRVPLRPGDHTLVLPLDTPPAWVALDPEAACLVEVDEAGESESALRARLADADAPVELRARTCRLLAGRGSPQNTSALGAALAEDPSFLVRREAASALGAHRSEGARAHLHVAVEGEPDWRPRAAAGAALGKGADVATVRRIGDALKVQTSPAVCAGLLAGAGQVKDPAARELIRSWLNAPSPRDTVAAAAVSALAAQEDKEVLDELLLRAEAGHRKAVRRAAIAGLARVAKAAELDAAERRRVREALEALLGDGEFAARYAAAHALAKLAEPASRAALQRAHGAEPFALIRRAYREALGALPS
jgi:aminopeptidase N